MPGIKFNAQYMTVVNVIPNASAALFTKRALKTVGTVNESIKYCADWYFWICIAEQGKVAYVAEEHNFFRCHEKSTRAKGFTAEVSSDYLACRLKAQLASTNAQNLNIGIIKIIQLLSGDGDRARRLMFILGAILWEDLRRAFTYYQKLNDAPRISAGAWLAIGSLSLLTYCFNRYLIIVHRAGQYFKRGKSRQSVQ